MLRTKKNKETFLNFYHKLFFLIENFQEDNVLLISLLNFDENYQRDEDTSAKSLCNK